MKTTRKKWTKKQLKNELLHQAIGANSLVSTISIVESLLWRAGLMRDDGAVDAVARLIDSDRDSQQTIELLRSDLYRAISDAVDTAATIARLVTERDAAGDILSHALPKSEDVRGVVDLAEDAATLIGNLMHAEDPTP